MKYFILISLFLLSSCEKQKSLSKCYEIEKHYSKHLPKFTKGILNGFFYSECHFNDNQINKICGVSNYANPQKESLRIGYLSKGDSLRIYAYYYINSKRDSFYMETRPTKEEIYFFLKLTDSKMVLQTDGNLFIKEFEKTKNKKNKNLLFPYYGGENKVSKSCKICLNLLY